VLKPPAKKAFKNLSGGKGELRVCASSERKDPFREIPKPFQHGSGHGGRKMLDAPGGKMFREKKAGRRAKQEGEGEREGWAATPPFGCEKTRV